MKSKRTDGTKAKGFPCLMLNKHTDTVVLFSESGRGMVISSDSYEIGEYHGDWITADFELYSGAITLEN